MIIRMFGDEQTHHMAADETGASGDKYVSFSHIESGSAFEKIPRAKLQQKSINAKKRQSPASFLTVVRNSISELVNEIFSHPILPRQHLHSECIAKSCV